jgi:AcrR family transcriptional regulator
VAKKTDRREEKTRQALHQSFFKIVQQRDYQTIKIADIIDPVEVGRSTFYEHFRNKDALLASSLQGPFEALLTAISEQAQPARLTSILQHFWENRVLARSLLAGPMRRHTAVVLAHMIEQQFKTNGLHKSSRQLLPSKLAASAIANALLSPVASWLSGEAACSVEKMATALRQLGRACLLALSTTQEIKSSSPGVTS